MPRVKLGDHTKDILKGILSGHGYNTVTVAKAFRRPVGTVSYQIRNAESMSIDNFRRYIDLIAMSDEEIVRVIRG